ncbi:TolC family outer membrane protein [Pseudoteredinibacter isoporae]|uniref:Adhesin transport system outer membrane protein n=1 Tax=Pseudoteredinibacter isoporae TaxID=570281 RepID=A0A7X0MY01_9GAMM|nr:TolC family outer membrane protein [Pseudoteredinibacter isoporae]MBB6521492.1 adhesin transport system outer membrane protein [Pseudoteredinibacter isoporae]NHO87046.1 TolC family outer membrane protein [Pseudoteredinibacter isoporae]NIB24501.1 TolC family outer membrane protein [Pseudoteredinibacter isoporae]
MKIRTIALLAGIVGTATAQAEHFNQAVQAALDSHPEISAAKNQLLSREQEIKGARSGYLPSIDIALGIGRENTQSPTTGQNEVNLTREEASISARQLIFDGFATRSEVRRQEARAASASHSISTSQELIALRTSEVYLALMAQVDLLKLAEASLEEHKSIYDQMVLRNQSGVGSRADLDQIAARLALANSNVVVADANLKDSVTNYYRVVGSMPNMSALGMPNAAESLPASLDEATELALANHPTLKTANADIDATLAQHEAAKSSYYPDIRLEADQNWNEDIGGVVGEDERSVIAIRARYNLYRGGADKARRKQTSYLIEEAKDVRNNTRRQVVEGLRLSWTAFESVNAQLQYLQQHVNSAEATKKAYIEQFNIGRRTLLDLLNTENEVVDAKRNLIQAAYNKKLAELRVYNSMGVLLPKLGLAQ